MLLKFRKNVFGFIMRSIGQDQIDIFFLVIDPYPQISLLRPARVPGIVNRNACVDSIPQQVQYDASDKSMPDDPDFAGITIKIDFTSMTDPDRSITHAQFLAIARFTATCLFPVNATDHLV